MRVGPVRSRPLKIWLTAIHTTVSQAWAPYKTACPLSKVIGFSIFEIFDGA